MMALPGKKNGKGDVIEAGYFFLSNSTAVHMSCNVPDLAAIRKVKAIWYLFPFQTCYAAKKINFSGCQVYLWFFSHFPFGKKNEMVFFPAELLCCKCFVCTRLCMPHVMDVRR